MPSRRMRWARAGHHRGPEWQSASGPGRRSDPEQEGAGQVQPARGSRLAERLGGDEVAAVVAVGQQQPPALTALTTVQWSPVPTIADVPPCARCPASSRRRAPAIEALALAERPPHLQRQAVLGVEPGSARRSSRASLPVPMPPVTNARSRPASASSSTSAANSPAQARGQPAAGQGGQPDRVDHRVRAAQARRGRPAGTAAGRPPSRHGGSPLVRQHDGQHARKNLRAGLYARVSTEDRGQDPETQLRPLREYAERRGFVVVGEFVDQRLRHDRDEAAVPEASRGGAQAGARCRPGLALRPLRPLDRALVNALAGSRPEESPSSATRRTWTPPRRRASWCSG